MLLWIEDDGVNTAWFVDVARIHVLWLSNLHSRKVRVGLVLGDGARILGGGGFRLDFFWIGGGALDFGGFRSAGGWS